ncbi:type IV pilus modification protein PilV [Xylophilus sp. Kf1]|nr:type IV pilus modification protein PilV [Xylophilus sp. Kf1]
MREKSCRQSGFSMIEAMVAALVLAVGLLALGHLLVRQLVELRQGNARAIALQHVHALAESMLLNAGAARSGRYALAWNTARAATADCRSSSCDAEQLADHDLDLWVRSLRAALPSAQGTVTALPASTQIAIGVAWRSQERAMSPADAALQTSLTEVTAAATGIECPAGFSCHVGHVSP